METKRGERPMFIVIHDYCITPGECFPGEAVLAIILYYRGSRYWIRWGPTHLILIDFLCRHRWIALDAWQVATKMREDPFVQQHAMNAPCHEGRPARTSRTSVRQQIKRSREVLAELIRRGSLDLNVFDILRSEPTSSSTTGYRITIDVTWEHWPDTDEGDSFKVSARIPTVRPGAFGSGEVQWPRAL